jgi:rubrerythrin
VSDVTHVTRPAAPASGRSLTRRDAFRAGGVALAGAAVLAACSSDDDPVAVTGVTGPEPTSTTLPPASDADLVFLRTAASLELAAASFYGQVLDIEERELDAELREVSVLFEAHHQQHADLLDRVIGEAGGEEVEEPNEVYSAELVDAPLAAATTEEEVLQAALVIEETAAGAYVDAGGSLSRPDLREKALSIGGADARHVTYLGIVLDEPDLVPEAFAVAVPLDPAAELPVGTVTPPEEESTDEEPADGESTETTEAE